MWTDRSRVNIIKGMVCFFFLLVVGRLAQIQIVQADYYSKLAQKQYQSKIILPFARGTVYDRNGNILASNCNFVSFAADPKRAADEVESIASTFARVFGKPKQEYLHKLDSDKQFVWLERQVPLDYLNRINPEKLPGIVVRYEPKRLYHNDQVAGQLIGSTDIDNKGITGIEHQFNKELEGTDGYVIFQRDGIGHARPVVDYPRLEPVNGNDIYLTIDVALQSIAEEELRKGVETKKADGGTVVLLAPSTGEVLAVAQYPFVNPNKFSHSDQKDQRLRAVTDAFEPGSVFKLVTASTALEHKLVKPDDKFYAEQGVYYVPIGKGRTCKIQDVHPYGWISFQQAIEFSSNIVMAKISNILGAELLYKMARDYGFGMQTDIDLPSESRGLLKNPKEWSATTLNRMSFGYEVGVTALQISAAYAAVANGGLLMRPYILRKEIDASGHLVKESQPQIIRRVISPPTVGTLKDFFTGVVLRGTAKSARIEGIEIAGKTGTSRRYGESGYESKSYTASFVGFFPVDSPQLLCLVTMDNPRSGSYTGGTASAPVFHEITQRILTTTQFVHATQPAVSPSGNQAQTQEKSLQTKNRSARISDTFLAASHPFALTGDTLIPDVRGFSARRAVGLLSMEKLEPVVLGSGVVVQQEPRAGMPSHPRMRIVLTCQPKFSNDETGN